MVNSGRRVVVPFVGGPAIETDPNGRDIGQSGTHCRRGSARSTVRVTAPQSSSTVPESTKRPLRIEQVAETAVGLRKEGGLDQPGFVLKGQELHGLTGFGGDELAADEPAREAHPPADMPRQLDRPHRPGPPHGVGVEHHRVAVAEEPQHGELAPQAFVRVVGR